MAKVGDPPFAIVLPNAGETLGLQFSVFGTCPEIKITNSPTITVQVMDGNTQVATATAVLNNAQQTFEAFFNLPAGTKILGTGSVVVTCTGMKSLPPRDQLTIADQTGVTDRPTLSVNNPGGDGVVSWRAGVTVSGTVSNGQGKTMYLRMTDRGFDLLPFPHYISWTIQNDGNWQSPDLTTLVPSGSAPTSSDSKCCVHMSVWQAPVGEKIRASSGPFSVGS